MSKQEEKLQLALGLDRPVTPEDIRAYIRYEAETGLFYWGERGAPHAGGWNSEMAGKPCGGINEGYRILRICRVTFKAHRVAFFVGHGRWPQGNLDHINGDTMDNRVENLREVTNAQNAMNAKRRKDNRSGAKGVSYHTRVKVWEAFLRYDRRKYHIGSYKTFSEAKAAREAFEQKMFGEYSALNRP